MSKFFILDAGKVVIPSVNVGKVGSLLPSFLFLVDNTISNTSKSSLTEFGSLI